MSTAVLDRPAPPRRRPLADLGGQPALASFGPGWFTAVMGTGIVAGAAATLPVRVPGLLDAARVVWLLDAVLLAAVLTATVVHHRRHPGPARALLADPVARQAWGAPAMALLTVGAGALLLGRPLLGGTAAVATAAVLWVAGTLLGLATAVALPYLAFVGDGEQPDAVSGGWLVPVVPPMVSAATGPLLVPHLPPGQWRLTLLLACAALFGAALLAALVTTTLLWGRLVHHALPAAAAVPTLWIVLGPLGQAVTAAHTVGAAAPAVLPAPYGTAAQAAGVVVGLPLWGFALLWAGIATAVTVRTARRGLPFSLTWWSFTFPVGTVVTGTSALAAATGAHALAALAVVLYAVLVAAWATVAVRTALGTWSGRLLLAPR